MNFDSVARPFTLIQLAVLSLALSLSCVAQDETIVHTFTNGSDGGFPRSPLLINAKGNLYGLASSGGANCFCGVAYQLVRGANGNWTQNILYNFGSSSDLSDGADPSGPLTPDGKGNLYGTAIFSGSASRGLVFKLSPSANGSWTESVLYSFTGGNDGEEPSFGVVFDQAGNLYGETTGGEYGFGVIFELSPNANGTWTEKTIYSMRGEDDGAFLYAPLVIDQAGNLYGVAMSEGPRDFGSIFELVKGSNGHWTEKTIHAFTGGAGGYSPTAISMDANGNLFGGAGSVAFELSPASDGTWTFTSIHNFQGGSDGMFPNAAMIMDSHGNIFGSTSTGGHHEGTVFELSPASDGTWTEKVLHRFSANGVDGVAPTTALVLDSHDNLFGVTASGGSSNAGVVYEIKP